MVYEYNEKRCANCRHADKGHPVAKLPGFAYCEILRRTVYLWQNVLSMPCEGGRAWKPKEYQSALLN